jgi:hypothetical protein
MLPTTTLRTGYAIQKLLRTWGCVPASGTPNHSGGSLMGLSTASHSYHIETARTWDVSSSTMYAQPMMTFHSAACAKRRGDTRDGLFVDVNIRVQAALVTAPLSHVYHSIVELAVGLIGVDGLDRTDCKSCPNSTYGEGKSSTVDRCSLALKRRDRYDPGRWEGGLSSWVLVKDRSRELRPRQ